MTRTAAAALAAAATLAACAGPADDTIDPDGSIDGDGDGGQCVAPIAAPAWLDAYVTDQVARLSGAADITPGVRLTDRATVAHRTTARTYLRDQLAALGLDASLDDYGPGANVIGRLPASDGGTQWIVIGAHFDTVTGSPGANDNATGVAAVLATARALTALPCRSRGVMFVLFDQEEVGLIGSTSLAGREFQAGTPIAAVHTIDQVGWDADRDRRFEVELPTAALLAEYQAGAAALGVAVVETATSGTDHTAFRDRGFAAVGLTEEYVGGDTTPYYHTPSDTFATVEPSYTALAARLVTYVVARELGAT